MYSRDNCFKEGELERNSVIKKFLTTAKDGKTYKTKYYNLDVIISVGCRVKSGKHIVNALKEELNDSLGPVVAKFATTASDGKTG